ncbi:hypothetical protein ACO1O0_007739 [Amphichorda felina]
MASAHHIACLCGTIRQDVPLRAQRDSDQVSLSLCHCNTCRHSSGVLCTSYYPIATPVLSQHLRTYVSPGGSRRYFCAVCGCHVFRSKMTSPEPPEWEVATGVIASSTGGAPEARYTRHIHVADTKDGGASVWIPSLDGWPTKLASTSPPENPPATRQPNTPSPSPRLPASCACGSVRFHITRPSPQSHLPHSSYPDLTHAYKTTPAVLGGNPGRDKWWIRPGGRYLAGTCACASCRLSTGFEIQEWAFVPRCNIFLHVPCRGHREGGQEEDAVMPLDFEALPEGILTSYSSSPGVVREFCAGCGATVFWHDGIRPGVIDVSVGLLRAEDGARAEGWLRWWTGRVSFEEETETGREGAAARTARGLIGALEEGLRGWERSV